MANVKNKVFAWDTEMVLKEVGVSDFEKRVISIASLNGKEFVVIATHKKIKGAWKPVKNATVPKDLWGDIVEAVGDYDLKAAFGSTTDLQAPAPAKKAPARKAPPKPEPAKKAPAKKAPATKEPAATLQGIKTGLNAKLQKNANWAKLTPKKKQEALATVQKEHDEIGMVTIGISGTNYMVVSGKNTQQAETQIKATKGFSRAQFTFIA